MSKNDKKGGREERFDQDDRKLKEAVKALEQAAKSSSKESTPTDKKK